MFKKIKNIKIPVKALKYIVIILVVLLAVFLVVKIGFGNVSDVSFSTNGLDMTDAKPAISQIDSTSNVETLVAETDNIQFYYTPSNDLFRLVYKDTGEEFRSWPDFSEYGDVKDDGSATSAAKILQSPVSITYTENGKVPKSFAINQVEGIVKTVNIIENGLQLTYLMSSPGNGDTYDVNSIYYDAPWTIEFSVEFTIENNQLTGKVPFNSIKENDEDKEARMVSISMLPYIGAARQNDDGYYVVPDGTGALVYFSTPRYSTFYEYEKKVYGNDLTFDQLSKPDYVNETITSPVYGVVKNNTMLSSYVKVGDSNVSLRVGTPYGAVSLPYYNIGFKFFYRQSYNSQYSKAADQFTLFEENSSIGDAVQVFDFQAKESDNDNYTYVDFANNARSFVSKKWLANYGEQKETLKENATSINLKVFLGAENRTGGLLNTTKVMTTFAEVKEIYNYLSNMGITNIRISVLGWQNNGYYGNITDKYNPEKDFGGKNGLKDLTDWAIQKGIELSFENNLILMYDEPTNGVSLRNAVVKKPGTDYLSFSAANSSGVYRGGTNFYILSPEYYTEEYLSKDLKNLSSYNVKNVDLLTVGTDIMTDYNKQNAALRIQTINTYVDWIKKYGEKFDAVSVYNGNDYSLLYADNVFDFPIETSNIVILDETVPILPIMYHGMIDYYTGSINKEDNENTTILKAIEYGSLFSYEVTYRSTEELKYTYYSGLFKSKYTELANEILKAYTIAQDVLQPLRHETIVNHYRAINNEDVFCTEYSNGTKILVNYTSIDYTVILQNAAGIEITQVVPANNYSVVK